ncbi:uncharacterized protein LOC110856042 [Folsomia candida]|uniref:uncharacterized protein LOC110856042 n=1 Tax=Folsomia candida TaxID=158441 RepID=UPI00160519EC|nr:uncharacterized protein LOC110856042 [Folsomia candida]
MGENLFRIHINFRCKMAPKLQHIFLLLLHILPGTLCQSVITVYTEEGNEGISKNLTVSGCLESLDVDIDSNFSSVNTNDNCFQLYKRTHCTGEYLLVRPGSEGHGSLTNYGFSNNVRSVGSCFEDCHPDRVEYEGDMKTGMMNVKFYGRSAKTPVANINLRPNICFNAGPFLAEWPTDDPFRVQIYSSACLTLHQFSNCTGLSTYLTGGKHSDPQKLIFWADRFKSQGLSFCDRSCNLTIKDVLPPKEFEESEQISLFKYKNFGGDRLTSLNLNPGKLCTPFPPGWSNPGSIIVDRGGCIRLYDDSTCTKFMGEVIGSEKFLGGLGFNKGFGGIKSCENIRKSENDCAFWIIFLLIIISILIIVGGVVIWKMSGNNFLYTWRKIYRTNWINMMSHRRNGTVRGAENGNP